jgi:hypothetical protein
MSAITHAKIGRLMKNFDTAHFLVGALLGLAIAADPLPCPCPAGTTVTVIPGRIR